MSDLLARLDELLKNARDAATLERASFGFPNDKLQIARAFRDCDFKTGDEVHPDDYIRTMVRLHHDSWIIKPIDQVRDILKAHGDLLVQLETLTERLRGPEFQHTLDMIVDLRQRLKLR